MGVQPLLVWSQRPGRLTRHPPDLGQDGPGKVLGRVCWLASWACFATVRCETVGLGLWVCGCVCGYVCLQGAGIQNRKPFPFQSSRACVSPRGPLCVAAHRTLGSFQGLSQRPLPLGGRDGAASSPAPSPASGAGGTSPIAPCSSTRHPGLSNCAVGSLTLPRWHSCWDTHSTY